MTGRRVRIPDGEIVVPKTDSVMQIDCVVSVIHIACFQQMISGPDTKHAGGKVHHNLF